jgi:hypothetical protein
MEVVAWVNNDWQTQWISGYISDDVGSFMVQVGCMVDLGIHEQSGSGNISVTVVAVNNWTGMTEVIMT